MALHSMGRTIARTVLVAVMLLGLVGGLVGCGVDDSAEPVVTPAPAPAPEEPDGAEAPGEDSAQVLVESKCSGCHELDRVLAKSQDRAGWESTVARMESQGLSVTDEERETIIEYLAGRE